MNAARIALRALTRSVLPAKVRRAFRPSPQPWVSTLPTPAEPTLLENFGFHAIVGTWMEADVIADTVANAFAQGVDRVFVLDNESPDDTVERAVAAGAEHVMTYRTGRFEEQYRYNLMNEFVRHNSDMSDYDHIWWLWMDADEFPRPQGPGSLRGMLRELDSRYRVIGARFINHYPTPGMPAFVPGEHPAIHQELCEELPLNICAEMHRKHPLQRWDRGGERIDAGLGFHRAECAERPLFEPPEPIVVHHVPFREEAVTRRRMNMLWSGGAAASRAKPGDVATDHMEARRDSLDAVYSGDWARVRNFMPGAPDTGVHLTPWIALVPTISADLPSLTTNATDRTEHRTTTDNNASC